MKKLYAFTLVELVMVIIVMGIVAGIGAEIIVKLYDSYFRTKTINALEFQVEITLEQIAKRFSYRIRGSEAVIRGGVNIFPLSSQIDTDCILTWIGMSNESFRGQWAGARMAPGWSGLMDFASVNTNAGARTLMSPGSRFDFADNIIQVLTYGDVSFAGTNRPALIPKTSKNINIQNFYNNTNTDYTVRVGRLATDNSVLTVATGESTPVYLGIDGGKGLSDEYYLSHTAYAIVPSIPTDGDVNNFELQLRYNYQPWNGDNYNTPGIGNRVLAKHVSTFRFRRDGDGIRIKLCLKDANENVNYNISACKETVVF